jgi:hypothetical protein
MSELFSQAEVRKALSTMLEPVAVFEVRALGAQLRSDRRTGTVTVSGYFDNVDLCLSELEKLTIAKGIYFTLNPVDRALLARRANRLDYADRDGTTKDQHILRRVRLLIDGDYDRPSGISATDAEKAAAKKKAREIYGFLKERGWPEPVVADSGNGYHLDYRIDLPCEDNRLIEKVLAALADCFDGDGVKIDRSVHNPARIVRLYGTLAAKGDNTKERPHRLSKILRAPESLELVSAEQLRALVDELKPEEPAPAAQPAAHNAKFDMEAFLSRHGVAVAERSTEANGTIKWRLERCVFNPDHETPDAAVFQSPDGKLGHKCFHTSCVDKHWKEFRRHFEPDYDSASNSEEKSGPRKSAATELVELAEGFAFFHDDQDRPFVRLERNGHREIWPVESTKFRKLLAREYYKKMKKAINRNALSDAITTLAGKACHDGGEEPVFLRVAPHGGNILIDLCDEEWRVVEVTPQGWRNLDCSPVAFIRTGSMQALPEPIAGGGSIEPLWRLLNVTKAQRPLVAGALLNYFHPHGPYFVLNFVGEHGAAKSCAARILRQLVDPNQNPLRSPPKEEQDLLVQAACNRCVALDNLSSLPWWLSDGLCRLATGGGHSARELYTNLEEISIAVKRPVIINGIEDVAARPDLADRCLQIELETISGKKRMLEEDLWPEFEKQRAAIFSAILDALVCALRELPGVRLDSLPRMADAARWATAGETAFGWERGTFISAYTKNLDESAIASLEAHPVGVAIGQLLEAQEQWSGTSTELLETLNALVTEEQRKKKSWPENARALGHDLRRLAPAMRRAGISFERDRSKRRIIQMCKVADKTSKTSTTTPHPASEPRKIDDVDDVGANVDDVHTASAPQENDDVDDVDDLSTHLHVDTETPKRPEDEAPPSPIIDEHGVARL